MTEDIIFEWDSTAQEVRNSDRSLWLRRQQEHAGQASFDPRHEAYGVFQEDYSVGFMSSRGARQDELSGGLTVPEWKFAEDGRPITVIDSTAAYLNFTLPLKAYDTHGPSTVASHKFDTVERMNLFLEILPAMLAVLPFKFNEEYQNQRYAEGRVGYKVVYSDSFKESLSAGKFLL